MKRLNIDIESYSDVDLFKHGVYRYVDSPNFEILICAYAIDGGEVVSIDMTQEELPDELLEALEDPNVLKPAYNAQFERVCFGKYIGHNLDPAQWRCTMVHAAQLGLSGSLDAVSKYLGLDETKDAAGKALIRFFSLPCKPTKANGMRTRNYPKDDPEKWQQFIEYCEQDVRAEMAIGDELEAYPVKDSEWELYALDQRINDRGVLTDNALVEGAVQIMEDYSADINGKMKDLMGIDNPNSLMQFKAWLTEQGYDFPGLGKELVKEALKNGDVSGKAKTALEMRLNASISSVKKYQLMHDIECEDERIHGLLQFYGAGRTGRWAGRLVQVQNLPRNYLEDLDTARTLVKAKDWELLQLCYESVPDTVKQLIRTALIAKEGHTFYVSDFSAIEARVIAWYAGEQWRLDVFNTGGDIYKNSAAAMFHIPLEDIDKELRQRGKVSELACIAEGQLVLTDSGLKPIETISTKDRLWDGTSWVAHEGLIYKGQKEVLSYEGLVATADHIVWEDCGQGKYRQVHFGDASARRAHLAKTGDGRHAVRLGESHKPGKEMERRLARSYGARRVSRLRKDILVASLQSDQGKIEGLSNVFPTAANSEVVGPSVHGSETTLHKSKRPGLQELWRSRNRVSLRFGIGSRALHDRGLRLSGKSGTRNRPHRCGGSLREGQPSLGNASSKLHQPTAVFDILNAGPNNRFTVSDVLVHNCGYQGGPGALVAMGAIKMGVPEEELQGLVDAWRKASPNIVNLWSDVQEAAFEAVESRKVVKLEKQRLVFFMKAGTLFIKLPSGRNLAYPNAKLERGKFGMVIKYDGKGEKVGFVRLETYGGKLVENIVQATARDILGDALIRLDKVGFEIVFHVHDEIVAEVPKDSHYSIEDMNEIMGQSVDWAPGLPLRSDGYTTDYYKKD